MNTWIKCLCAFLLAACVSYVFQETIEARGLLGLLSGKKESVEEQTSGGSDLLQIVDGLTDMLDKTVSETVNAVNSATSEGKLLSPLGLGGTTEHLTEVVKSTVNTVTETTTTVTREVENVTSKVDTILTAERDLLSGQGVTQLVQDVAGTVDSAVGAVVKTVETAASGTEGIIKDAEATVVSTKPLLPVPGLVEGIGQIVGGVGETVGITGDLAVSVGNLVSGLIGSGQSESKPESKPDDPGSKDSDEPSSDGNGTSPNKNTRDSNNIGNSGHPSVSGIPEKSEETGISGSIGNSVKLDFTFNDGEQFKHAVESDIQHEDSAAEVKEYDGNAWPFFQLDAVADKGFKQTAADGDVQTKPCQPNRSQSNLPLQKKDKGVNPFTLAITFAKPVPKNGTGSSSGGSSSAGGVDMILVESVSDKEVGRRNIAKDTRQFITKWANEPPTEPPQHFLFSIYS